MVLETIEAETGDGLNPKYDFIREFARYDLGEYPLFYFLRTHGIVLLVEDFVNKPEILLGTKRMKYLYSGDSHFEFELMGHVFGVQMLKRGDLMTELYAKETAQLKRGLFRGAVLVKYFNDVDLLLQMFKDDGGYENWLSTQHGNRLLRF